MEGKDERAGVGDLEIVGSDPDALPGELPDLVLQRPGIEDDAIADHRQRAADDAGGKQRQFVGHVADLVPLEQFVLHLRIASHSQ